MSNLDIIREKLAGLVDDVETKAIELAAFGAHPAFGGPEASEDSNAAWDLADEAWLPTGHCGEWRIEWYADAARAAGVQPRR